MKAESRSWLLRRRIFTSCCLRFTAGRPGRLSGATLSCCQLYSWFLSTAGALPPPCCDTFGQLSRRSPNFLNRIEGVCFLLCFYAFEEGAASGMWWAAVALGTRTNTGRTCRRRVFDAKNALVSDCGPTWALLWFFSVLPERQNQSL